jgi:hypothetical protein
MSPRSATSMLLAAAVVASVAACSSDDGSGVAHVRLQNDFNDPEVAAFQPPWTICKSSYQGAEFGKIELGKTSDAHDVPAGLDVVLMVAAWDDPTCDPAHSLPIATKSKEEVVSGQTRTIAIAMTNHQGPCPPEGVPPIPEEQYNRILKLWPQYNFKAYADRALNAQCAGSGAGGNDGGAEGGADAATEAGGDAGDP